MKPPIIERFGHEILVGDGAMGTLLAARRETAVACLDALNLDPHGQDDVRAVHVAYRDAGAMLLEANTFGAHGGAARPGETRVGARRAVPVVRSWRCRFSGAWVETG